MLILTLEHGLVYDSLLVKVTDGLYFSLSADVSAPLIFAS